MSRIPAAAIAVLMWAPLAAQVGPAQSGSAQPASGFSVQHLDRAADACTDFYQFACGNWIATHPLPGDRTRYGRMAELADRNEQIVRGILERAAARQTGRTPNEQKIGDYYASCMAETSIDGKGTRPIAPLMREIDAVTTRAGLIQLAARLARLRIGGFLNLGSAPDSRDSSTFLATIGEGTIGLTDRDLYLLNDARANAVRTEYVAHLQRMFQLLGETPDQATASMQAAMAVESVLARATYDRVTLRDPRRRYNPMSIDQLVVLSPNLDIPTFVKAVGAPAITRVNVINPQYISAINAAIESLQLSDWKAYMKWRALSTMTPMLPSSFRSERFRFVGVVLGGQRAMPARWRECVTAVGGVPGSDQLGEIVGQTFVNEHFGADAAARMAEMIAALEQSLQRTINDVSWMSADTRTRALEKLKAINHKIGAPQKWRDFSALNIVRDDYLANSLAVAEHETTRQLGWIGQPVDRSLWLMTPQTVNAYFAPPLNEIAFPAGILQPPYFDPARDDAVNFGAIGAVIGHELSHGFDDQGRRFDARGNLIDWWTPADDQAFRERASCVAAQYSGFPAVETVRLNGNLTLGENVADNAGIRIAYYALMEVLARKKAPSDIDGFTPEQRLFLAWAQIWCENATDQDIRRRVQEDTHATGRWRVNGSLQNFTEFRKAFGCKEGAPMAPANACRVW